MVIDYSKWDKLGSSDSDAEAPRPSRVTTSSTSKAGAGGGPGEATRRCSGASSSLSVKSSAPPSGGLAADEPAVENGKSRPPHLQGKVEHQVPLYTQEHCRPFAAEEVPKMRRLAGEEGQKLVREEHIEFFKQKMTYPQRMMLFTKYWNTTAKKDDRVHYIKKLIAILEKNAKTKVLARRIGGGAEILEDVKVDVGGEFVSYPEQWVAYFGKRTVAERCEIFEGFFGVLEEEEQMRVVGGLSG